MQEYLINEDDVKDILEFLNNHKTLDIKKFFKELKPYENPLVEQLRRFLINKGKSSILHKEIQEIINEHGDKNKEP